ncbi:hypothetical protein [Clostridium sardiniense]|uniref:hypothetical protein n=1 Tax=Clostridium sardiniense TaxID=29369 RepID=UPI003D330616
MSNMIYRDYEEITTDDAFSYKESTSLEDKVLYYKKDIGLHKRFEVKYESDGPLYDIRVIHNDHNEIIKCDVFNTIDEKKVKIAVDIPKGLTREYNFKETILIYTDYDIREFSFSIECIDGSSNENNIIKLEEILFFNRSEENLLKIVNGIKRVDDILEITKKAPAILNNELSINTYIKIIKRCRSLSKENIKLSMFCEELLKKKGILLKDIIEPLKDMYKKGLVTKNTRDVLRYLRIGSSSDEELNAALINVKVKLKVVDEEFIHGLIILYSRSDNKKSLDKILNIILYSDNVKYNDELLKIIFDFYRRNNDVNSLIIICRELKKRGIPLKDYGIQIKDRNLLVKAYRKNILIDWKELLEYSEDYYKRSIYIRDALVNILEEIITNGKDKDKRYICVKYKTVIRDLSNYSRVVYRYYIENVMDSYTKKNLDKIITLENYLNNIGEGIEDSKRIEILENIIDFYIKNGDEKKYISYLKYYIVNLATRDENKCLKRIIENNLLNIEFLGTFIMRDGLAEVCRDDDILEIVTKGVIKNKKQDLLVVILKEYKKMERKDKYIPILKELIINGNFINNYAYNKLIIPIYNELTNDEKIDIYELLIKRKDLPISFREKNYNIYRSKENETCIVKNFLNGNSDSALSKTLALKECFNSDEEFLKTIQKGKDDPEVLAIVLKKIESKFYKDKDYVEKLISLLRSKNKEIRKIEGYIRDYYKYKDNLKLLYIFGNMRVLKRKSSNVCDFVILKGIFNKEESKGYLFKNDGSKNIIKKYLKEASIGFREIDSKILIINNEIEDIKKEKKNTISLEIRNILNLIKLQQGLILNGSMIVDFRANSFKYINEVILPKNLEDLVPYKKEYVCRNRDLFENDKIVTNDKGRLIINENNIVNLIKYFLHLRLELIDKKSLDENEFRVLNSIMKDIIQNKEVNTYGGLRDALKNTAKSSVEEFKVYKYPKYLEEYPKLKNLFKERVLELILNRGDTRKRAKEIAINYDLEVSKKEEYFSYLIDCFNEHYFDLDMFELQEIYEKVIAMIKEDSTITRNFQNELIELFLNTPKKCNYDSLEVLMEVRSLAGIENLQYIEEKMIS